MPLVLIAFGLSEFYYPRWARRIVAPRARAIRNHYRNRYGQRYLDDCDSDDFWVRLRTIICHLPREIRCPSMPPSPLQQRMTRAALSNLRITLIVLIAPMFLFAGVGLVAPPYTGPQPPASFVQWAHAVATRAAGFIFSRAAVPYLLVCAWLLLLYLWNRRRMIRSTTSI